MLMYDLGIVKIQKMEKLRYFASTMSMDINPNTFAGLVGKVQKKLRRKEGRVEKKARAACPRDQGSNPGPAAC